MTLQESLNELYEKIEDGYYSACDYIEKQLKLPIYESFINPIEDRGIPSFPIVIFLFLLMISGAAFLLLNSPSTSLKVIVVSEGENINGASVTLTSGTLARTIETKDGAAQFNNLPKGKDAKIVVSKQGFGDEERSFKIGSAPLLKIILTPGSGGAGFEVAVVDFSNAPLGGATVAYSYNGKDGEVADTAATGSNGIAALQSPSGTDVTIQVSLSGYETSPKITYLPEKGKQKKVILKKREASPTPQPSDNSQLEITVKDDADGSALEADLLIFDAASGELLKTASTTYGMYDTDDFKVGAKLRVKATADGYEPAVKEKTLVAGKTTLPMRLKKSASTVNSSIATIKVVDERNSALVSEIRLWEGLSEMNFTLLKVERASSELRSEAFDNRIYYATAFKDGYLPGRTMKFAGGVAKTITMIKADASNSLNLTINVANEDGLKIRDATIAFFDPDEYQVPPYDQKTNAQGKAIFRNFPKGEFRIIAVKQPNAGETTKTLSGSAVELNITLYAPTGTIEFSANDRENNTTAISQFDAFLYYKNERNNSLYKSCTATAGSCTIDARADKEFSYVVYSKNYQNATGNVKANPNNSTRIPALLYRLDSKIISEIILAGITDMNDGAVTELTTDQ
ncbi:MAG: carboxypeptidase-like regulatory domain-containing protein, partial [Candidatus Micrarchaeota archaeon]